MSKTDPIIRKQFPKTISDCANNNNNDSHNNKHPSRQQQPPQQQDFCNRYYSTSIITGRTTTTPHQELSQFDYIRNNLQIKSCLGANRNIFTFHSKKNLTIRNYTPKILNQEINMGLWM